MKKIIKTFTIMLAIVGLMCCQLTAAAASSSKSTNTVNGITIVNSANISIKNARVSSSARTGVVCKVSFKVYYTNINTDTTHSQSISIQGNGATSYTYTVGSYKSLYKMTSTHTAVISSKTFSESLKVYVD